MRGSIGILFLIEDYGPTIQNTLSELSYHQEELILNT
jgi:hypothetical protein